MREENADQTTPCFLRLDRCGGSVPAASSSHCLSQRECGVCVRVCVCVWCVLTIDVLEVYRRCHGDGSRHGRSKQSNFGASFLLPRIFRCRFDVAQSLREIQSVHQMSSFEQIRRHGTAEQILQRQDKGENRQQSNYCESPIGLQRACGLSCIYCCLTSTMTTQSVPNHSTACFCTAGVTPHHSCSTMTAFFDTPRLAT
jgi:hypothetical protein